MLILAVESSAQTASAALCRDGKLLGQYSVNSGNTHSTTLLPMAEQLLYAAGLTPDAVDLFACSRGPGSFTGVRIGVATVKGLAFGTDKPCVGVSALEALAYGLRGADGIVCPLIGARRSQYYAALFRVRGGEVDRLCEDDIVLAADLDGYLAGFDEDIRLCGDGYESALPYVHHPRLHMTPELLRWPGAFAVAECAAALYARTDDPGAFREENLSPLYLRKTQAEREREERLAGEEQPDGVADVRQ